MINQNQFDEQRDLDLVAAYFTSLGLSVKRFAQAETQTGRTPDFRVLQNAVVAAYCEVKSPNDPWLDKLLGEAPTSTIVGGSRSDPIFNRLARLFTKADTQFTAVNPTRAELNILAFVNHDRASHFGDLVEVLTGFFHATDGSKYSTIVHIAEGRIGEAKGRIDACLWFENNSNCLAGAVINDLDAGRVQRLCKLLAIDPQTIGGVLHS